MPKMPGSKCQSCATGLERYIRQVITFLAASAYFLLERSRRSDGTWRVHAVVPFRCARGHSDSVRCDQRKRRGERHQSLWGEAFGLLHVWPERFVEAEWCNALVLTLKPFCAQRNQHRNFPSGTLWQGARKQIGNKNQNFEKVSGLGFDLLTHANDTSLS